MIDFSTNFAIFLIRLLYNRGKGEINNEKNHKYIISITFGSQSFHPSGAAGQSPAMLEVGQTGVPVLSASGEVSPYYVAINSIFMDISKDGNKISGSAECHFLPGYTAKMTVNLQKSTNNSNWTKALTFGTVESSSNPISLYDSATVPNGYYYRVQANITIYEGSRIVDSATAYSGSAYIR